MTDRFLMVGSGQTNLSDGSADIFVGSVQVANLKPSMPVLTDPTSTLVSGSIPQSQVAFDGYTLPTAPPAGAGQVISSTGGIGNPSQWTTLSSASNPFNWGSTAAFINNGTSGTVSLTTNLGANHVGSYTWPAGSLQAGQLLTFIMSGTLGTPNGTNQANFLLNGTPLIGYLIPAGYPVSTAFNLVFQIYVLRAGVAGQIQRNVNLLVQGTPVTSYNTTQAAIDTTQNITWDVTFNNSSNVNSQMNSQLISLQSNNGFVVVGNQVLSPNGLDAWSATNTLITGSFNSQTVFSCDGTTTLAQSPDQNSSLSLISGGTGILKTTNTLSVIGSTNSNTGFVVSDTSDSVASNVDGTAVFSSSTGGASALVSTDGTSAIVLQSLASGGSNALLLTSGGVSDMHGAATDSHVTISDSGGGQVTLIVGSTDVGIFTPASSTILDPTNAAQLSVMTSDTENLLPGIEGTISGNVQFLVDSNSSAFADPTQQCLVLALAAQGAQPPIAACISNGLSALLGKNSGAGIMVDDVNDVIAMQIAGINNVFVADSATTFIDNGSVAIGPTNASSITLGNVGNSTALSTPTLTASSLVATDGGSFLTTQAYTPPASFAPVMAGSAGASTIAYTRIEGRFETINGCTGYLFHVEGTVTLTAGGDLQISIPLAPFAAMTIAGIGKAYVEIGGAPVATQSCFVLGAGANVLFQMGGALVQIVPGAFNVQGSLNYFTS
jgi:hypothetical protein